MRSWMILGGMVAALLIVISSGFIMLSLNQPSSEEGNPTRSEETPSEEALTAQTAPALPGPVRDTTQTLRDRSTERLLTTRSVYIDSLQTLFTSLHQQFRPHNENVDAHMIPTIRQVIALTNNVDSLTFAVDLFEPNGDLARARATNLGNMLRLYGLPTGVLQITGFEGTPNVFVSLAPPAS